MCSFPAASRPSIITMLGRTGPSVASCWRWDSSPGGVLRPGDHPVANLPVQWELYCHALQGHPPVCRRRFRPAEADGR